MTVTRSDSPSYLSILALQGAYFFTRSVLMTIRTLEGKENSVFDAEWKGWVLAAFFFLDAWLLGTCMVCGRTWGESPKKMQKLCLLHLNFSSPAHPCSGLALQRMAFGCLCVGIRVRGALTTALARKCFNMAHLTKDTASEAVSFVATHINK